MSMLLLPLLLLAQGAAPADPALPRDWAATLRTDAQAMHDDIAANHPGPVNTLDPDFSERNDAGLALALARASKVADFAGYHYALKAYAASFDDGHLGYGPTDEAPPLAARWPGFLTGFDGAAQVVKTRADDAPVPLGAVLESCDGKPADGLAAENVGAFEGRWFLASRRLLRGGQLFVDRGNPFIARPLRCRFRTGAGAREVTLDWRPIDDAALTARVRDTNQMARAPIAARMLADGTRWFALSGFDGNPDSADAKALGPLIEAMRSDRRRTAHCPRPARQQWRLVRLGDADRRHPLGTAAHRGAAGIDRCRLARVGGQCEGAQRFSRPCPRRAGHVGRNEAMVRCDGRRPRRRP
jgi:hypothetical protein